MIKGFCKKDDERLTPEYCEKMYLHYASFYKDKGYVITSQGVEDHTTDEPVVVKLRKSGGV